LIVVLFAIKQRKFVALSKIFVVATLQQRKTALRVNALCNFVQ